MANDTPPKRYRALEQIAGLLSGCAVIGYLIGALWLWAVYSSQKDQGSSGTAVFVALLPAISFAGVSLLLHALGQGIRLAIDCATHLATISNSLAARRTAPADPTSVAGLVGGVATSSTSPQPGGAAGPATQLPLAAPIDSGHAPTHPALYAALCALRADERAGRIPKMTPADLDRLASEHGVDLRAVSETLRQIAEDAMAEAVRQRLTTPREQPR